MFYTYIIILLCVVVLRALLKPVDFHISGRLATAHMDSQGCYVVIVVWIVCHLLSLIG